MPHLSLPFSGGAPVIDLRVGVSHPRADALRRAGLPVPPQIQVRALVDTGASCTSLDTAILNTLGVPTTGTVACHTPSTTSTQPHTANQYDVSLVLVHPLVIRTWHAIAVTESQLAHQGIQALIGRDVLSACLLTYDGQQQSFCLGF